VTVYITYSRVIGVLFLSLSCCYLYFGHQIPLDFWSEGEVFNARSMPYLIGISGIFVATALILVPTHPTTTNVHQQWRELKQLNWLPTMGFALIIALYGLSLEYLGFIFCSSLFLFCSSAILGERRWLLMVVLSVSIVSAFALLIGWLGIYLAPGDLWMGWLDV
jgi:putative tricarboxylic transport membrane protein